MPTNYSGRVTFIVVVLLAALWCVFQQPAKIFDSKLTLIQRTSLHPGIDMVGGVSLIYQVQGNANQPITQEILTKVMEILKQRVDPNGVRNLVWRPQPPDLLEIQMPILPGAADAPAKKQAYTDAQQQLDGTNIKATAVIDAVEKMTGAARDQRLAELAMGSQTRQALFDKLKKTFDQIQVLKSKPIQSDQDVQNLALQIQPLQRDYDDLKKQIEPTNLLARDYEDKLRAEMEAYETGKEPKSTDPDALEKLKKQAQDQLAQWRRDFAGFPARLAAMDNFKKRFEDYLTVSSSISEASDLEALLKGSGVLEFHILADSATVTNESDIKAMEARLDPGHAGPLPQPGDTMRWYVVDRPEEFKNDAKEWNGNSYVLAFTTKDAELVHNPGGEKWNLTDATRETNQESGQAEVGFKFDTTGGKLFGDLTEKWFDQTTKLNPGIHARLGIVLDNKLISAPNLNAAITGGSGVISGGGRGGFNTAELNYLINTFNAGSLPAQLTSEPINVQQVGPTLGADNLRRGLMACGFGLIVVAVFLCGYYYLAGLVAFAAVCMNLVLILGVMAAMQATFTLPSIAGVVLTIGTAVDANVLIFERLREEQHRGLPLRMALRVSYDRALSAIVDSNMTSAITSAFLYGFGSEEVKGFGLTLLIGILASMFTALFVTKTIFGLLIDHFGVKHLGSLPLTFPKWDRMLKPNWDWMGKAWIFYTFSSVMIVAGTTLFIIKTSQGKMMDIEFASGVDIEFKLKQDQPMFQEDVRKLLEAESTKKPNALPSPTVVAVGTKDSQGRFFDYEVVVPSKNGATNREDVKNAIIEAMGNRLELQAPSTFDQVDGEYDAAMKADVIRKVKDPNFTYEGIKTPQDAVGGAAIVLNNISPKLKADEITARLNTQRTSSSIQGVNAISYKVVPTGAIDQPQSSAVIFVWNPSVSVNVDETAWTDQLVIPAWKLTTSAINRPPSFEKETSFSPQIAGQMRNDAILSLSFSIVAIMIYIWVRFGNLKYGTATVICLVHDTIFTIAAIGFAHYLTDFWKDNFLQLQPFRINLTVVAGILTIMGYSMIDTIVVFDRIREKRGEYGHLDRDVINKAINETLSRTLLTCGTSVITVSFMYFLGGEGIHGFTFVLLVGILVGTYSSVGIASPLLLLGKAKELTAGSGGALGQLQRNPKPPAPTGAVGGALGQLQRGTR